MPAEPDPSNPPAWLVPPPVATAAVRRGRRWFLLALGLYAVALWFLVVPHGIGYSWRECDTQAIARNFLQDGFDPLRPRIDWRGDTDGAVECEFPFYQLAIASLLAVCGDVEWPGRLLSLLAVLGAALALHRLLEQRAGPGPALVGGLVFLGGGQAVLLGARVMPDAASVALGLAGLVAFVRYLGIGSGWSLGLGAAAVALGALQKPTTLQLGLLMLLWTLLLAPRRAREPRLWLALLLVPAVVAAWLVHAHGLEAETGLTFGVTAAGDTKFPAVEHLLTPRLHAQLARTTLYYGLSAFGLLGLFALVVQRRLDRADAALLGVVGVGLLATLRYSYHHGMGPQYHAFAAVAGAWCAARAWPARAPRWLWALLLVAVAAHATWQVAGERRKCEVCSATPLLDLAAAVRAASAPADLTVVRADKPRRDTAWARRNNYEDPRFLYHARRRGWVLPADGFDVATLADLQARGARIVVDLVPGGTPAATQAWLAAHAEVVRREPFGVVWRLTGAGG
ncbi:MAG: glycosyltransferase family 39 protein [Planctomycetes bacterium]|nr:glycosyltransferase family 39 protein [Planctomycetota bacterium]